MSEKFNEQFDGLLEKYTELLLGESNEEKRTGAEVGTVFLHSEDDAGFSEALERDVSRCERRDGAVNYTY